MDPSPIQVCPEINATGITTIYAPKEQEAIAADIVFVHGLKGHPRDTWASDKLQKGVTREKQERKSKSWKSLKLGRSNANPQIDDLPEASKTLRNGFWPFDLLSLDFKNLRIMTYGYDSHPTHFYKNQSNRMTISQQGRNLLNEVTNSRLDVEGRPIIFVAHSLGGILVKDTIVESQKYALQPHMQDIFSSCRAIFFFGTPHLGSDIANSGLILSNIVGALPGGPSTYGNVLRGLVPDSEKLDNLRRDFDDILTEQKIKIYSLQEGRGMSRLSFVDNKVSFPGNHSC